MLSVLAKKYGFHNGVLLPFGNSNLDGSAVPIIATIFLCCFFISIKSCIATLVVLSLLLPPAALFKKLQFNLHLRMFSTFVYLIKKKKWFI